MDELTSQIEADFQQDKSLIDTATVKQVYELAWRRGRNNGLTAGMEFAVIGEHLNEDHLAAVLETQRQIS